MTAPRALAAALPRRLSTFPLLLAAALVALAAILFLLGAPAATAQSNAEPEILPDPVSITRSESTHNSITVYWTAPKDNGATIRGYGVDHWEGWDGKDGVFEDIVWRNANTFEHTITGLKPDTKYGLAVKAVVGDYANGGYIHKTSTKPAPAPTVPEAIQIQFFPTMYTRTEGIDPYANVTVTRSPGANTENAIDFTLTAKEVPEGHGAAEGGASNATPGSDFTGGVHKGTIPAGVTSATVNIPLIDDRIAEVPEDFLVTLTSDDTSKAVVRDNYDEALVSLNDNDDVWLSYQTDYLKLGEPGWKHRTGELAIHVDIGTSKRITMTCRSKDGKIAPFEWDIPVSNSPQTGRVTVSPVKDADFKYDYDTLTCGLKHAPVMVKTEKLKSGIPVWVEDGDALNIPKGEFYLGGDMVKPGFQANMTLFVTRPEGVNSSETFSIEYLNPHYCDKAKMTGPSSVTVPESRGTNNILFSVQVPSDSCDVYVIRAMPTTPDTYQGAAKTGGFGLVHVVTPPRPGGL